MYSFSVIVPSRFVQDLDNLILDRAVEDESLIVDQVYKIGKKSPLGTPGDFINVGASSNADGTYFIATGTTPTAWNDARLLTYNSEREIYPFYEANGITRELVENTKFERDKFNGTLLVKGADYDMFYTYLNEATQNYSHKFEFRVYKDTTRIFTGYLLMNGSFNTIEKICTFNIETLDQYQKILANRDVKYDIINGVTPIISCSVKTNFNTLEFSLSALDGGSLWFHVPYDTDYPSDFDIFAREKAIYPTVLANDLILNENWVLLTDNNDGTLTIIRDWTVSGNYQTPNIAYLRTINSQPFPSWLPPSLNNVNTYFNELLSTSGYNSTWRYAYKKSQYIGYITAGYTFYYFIDFNLYYGVNKINYTRLRRLDDTIEWLVGQMDNAINFDSNSFTYFDNNEDLSNLLIAGITDIILNPTNTDEQDYPSTKGLLSFGQIMDLFAGHPFHLYWYLENISGIYYFRLKHISELISLGASQIDFTNLQSKNWCEDKGSFNFKSNNFFGKIIINNISGNVGFSNQIIDTSLVNVKNNYEKNIDTFYFDVWDIQNNKTKYPNLSTEQFVLLSCSKYNMVTNFFNNDYPDEWADFQYDIDTHNLYLETPFTFVHNSYAWSNSDNYNNGQKYYISFDSLVITGAFNCFQILISVKVQDNAPVYSDVITLLDGVLDYELTSTRTGISNILIRRFSATPSTLTATNFRVKKDDLECNNSVSQITGQPTMNADLSIANIIENHGKYEFPSSPVVINGVSTIVETEKIKEQETILVPIYDQNDIDFRKYVTTNLGNECEVESLTINFNEDFAQIKVKL